MTAASFARRAVDGGNKYGVTNGWLNQDGSVTHVEHHEEGGGYTQATLQNKVRIIATPRRGELVVDSTLMNKPLTQQQIDAVRVMFAQTKAKTLYLSGPHRTWGTQQLETRDRYVEGYLKELNEAIAAN